MLTPEEFMAGAEAEPLGKDWGEPLWRFHNEVANLSIDVYAPDEEAARAVALEQVAPLLEARA